LIQYPNFDNITVSTTDKGRIYFTPEGAYPSITTILGKTSDSQIWLQKWIDKVGVVEAKRVSKVATDRGTKIHDYLERYWNGENIAAEVAEEASDVIHMTNNLIRTTSKGVTNVLSQEIPLWHNTLEYAGRVDMIGSWNGTLAVIDFKTSKKNKSIKQIKDYYVQCTAYALAHNILYGTDIRKIVILITVEGKDVQVFESDMRYFVPELKNRVMTFGKYHKDNLLSAE